MIVAVADTHAVIWYLSKDSRLSSVARDFIENCVRNREQIGISGITFVEIVYLIEKHRIPVESLSTLSREIQSNQSIFVESPLDLAITRSLSRIDVMKIPEMSDRIIAATALHFNVPVISRDHKIQLSGIATIW